MNKLSIFIILISLSSRFGESVRKNKKKIEAEKEENLEIMNENVISSIFNERRTVRDV